MNLATHGNHTYKKIASTGHWSLLITVVENTEI